MKLDRKLEALIFEKRLPAAIKNSNVIKLEVGCLKSFLGVKSRKNCQRTSICKSILVLNGVGSSFK